MHEKGAPGGKGKRAFRKQGLKEPDSKVHLWKALKRQAVRFHIKTGRRRAGYLPAISGM